MRLLVRFEHQKAANEFLDFKPTLFFGVPTIYIRLLEQSNEVAKQIGEHMRLFACGSAPLPPQVMEDFESKYGHVILERYGMTEIGMAISNPYHGERRAGYIGKPLEGVAVRLVNEEYHEVKLGEPGEILVRGKNVFKEYLRNERENEIENNEIYKSHG